MIATLRCVKHVARGIALAFIFTSSLALAGVHRLTGSHPTQKSPEEIWRILTAYSEICGKGCRYERPDLIRVKKLTELSTPNSWYTWSHVDNALRDVTYYSRVSVQWNADGGFYTETLQLNSSHNELIAKLEGQTGLKHRPAFDTANTTTQVTLNGKSSLVTQKVVLSASGLVDLWPAKIVSGIKAHMDATFRNIGP